MHFYQNKTRKFAYIAQIFGATAVTVKAIYDICKLIRH